MRRLIVLVLAVACQGADLSQEQKLITTTVQQLQEDLKKCQTMDDLLGCGHGCKYCYARKDAAYQKGTTPSEWRRPKAVANITDMAEKISQIMVGSYALGGPRFMPQKDIDRIYTRPDEKYREKTIAE